MDTTDLNRTLRQPVRYWNIDGLPLLGMGALWLLVGAGTLLMESAQRYWKLSALPLMVLFLGAAFGLNPFLKKIKARITESRTGAIRVRKAAAWPARVAACSVSFVVAALFVVLKQGLRGEMDRALPAAAGLVTAGAYMYAWRRYELPTYLLVGLAALLTGLGVSISRVAFPESMGWFFMVFGAASMLGGAHDLRAYLRAHPKPAQEEAGAL